MSFCLFVYLREENTVPSELNDTVEANVMEVHEWVRVIASSSSLTVQQITEVIVDAFITNDIGLTLLPHCFGDSAKLSDLGYDFLASVRLRQHERKSNRIRLERVLNFKIIGQCGRIDYWISPTVFL